MTQHRELLMKAKKAFSKVLRDPGMHSLSINTRTKINDVRYEIIAALAEPEPASVPAQSDEKISTVSELLDALAQIRAQEKK